MLFIFSFEFKDNAAGLNFSRGQILGINGILSMRVLLESSQNIRGWPNMKKSKFSESEK